MVHVEWTGPGTDTRYKGWIDVDEIDALDTTCGPRSLCVRSCR